MEDDGEQNKLKWPACEKGRKLAYVKKLKGDKEYNERNMAIEDRNII